MCGTADSLMVTQ